MIGLDKWGPVAKVLLHIYLMNVYFKGRMRVQKTSVGDLLPPSPNPRTDQCSYGKKELCFQAGEIKTYSWIFLIMGLEFSFMGFACNVLLTLGIFQYTNVSKTGKIYITEANSEYFYRRYFQ